MVSHSNMSRRPPDLNFSIGVASARINSLCSLTKREAFAKREFLIAASPTACYLYIGKFARALFNKTEAFTNGGFLFAASVF
jgi:hypothetical protein